MTKKAFESIKRGLEDAIAYLDGDASRGVAHHVKLLDVKEVRGKLGLSQNEFARTFLVSPATVRNWEQGRREPEGPAKVLLQVIDREPAAVKRALRVAAPRASKRPRKRASAR